MKNFSELYASLKNSFKKRSSLDIAEGTVLDFYMLSTSEALSEAYEEIENNKNPHIFTNLKGDDIDKMAILINCPRMPNESDSSYLYRCMKWTMINASSNATSIESALSSLEYSSIATYVPYTAGTGTATVFLIPKDYDDTENCIPEAKKRLSNVISPDSYVNYIISAPMLVEISCYISFEENVDQDSIRENIKEKVKGYINSIAIGNTLSFGGINKIGAQEPGVDFFNTLIININGEPMRDLNRIQTIESKFLFKSIDMEVINA